MSSHPETGSFGPNAGLVDEMYDQYRADPSSVSPSWRDFFEDYRPEGSRWRPNGHAGASDDTPPRASPRGTPDDAPAPPEARRVPSVAPHVAAAGPVPARPAVDEPVSSGDGEGVRPLRGAAARIAANMEASLGVPTATSTRAVPARLLEVNRRVMNGHLERVGATKVSYTHLIGYAVIRALDAVPAMKSIYVAEPAPAVKVNDHVGLGLAVDMKRPDGTRTLLVPCIRQADTLDFAGFHEAYETVIRKLRAGRAEPDDFAGVTMTLTNPGTLGTVSSVPRLMPGQSVIVGVGVLGYPAEFEGADPRALAQLAVSKVVNLSSTYDHRVIQGAESGMFLAQVHELLCGADGFYRDVFRSLGVPYEAVRWRPDENPPDAHDSQRLAKQVHVQTLINTYRVRGHLIADLDPLRWKEPRTHPELDPATYGLTIWDLDREFFTDGLAGRDQMKLGDLLKVLRDAYCRKIGVEYMHIQEPDQKRWIQEQVEGVDTTLDTGQQLYLLGRLNAAEAFERFLHTKYVGHKRFGIEGAESMIPLVDEVLDQAARGRLPGGDARHGPPWSAERAGQHRGQVPGQDLQGVRGRPRPGHDPGLGRRQVPRGRDRQVRRPLGPAAAGHPRLQPVAPGGGRPGGRGHGAGQPGPDQRARGVQRAPARHPRRRRLRRPGRGGRDAEPVRPARLPGGGTIHLVVNNQLGFTTAPDRGPLVGVRHRRGQDGPGADLPRQRRRPRGVRAGGPAGLRVPPAVPQGRRHRHVLLPPPRPQRGRRPVATPSPSCTSGSRVGARCASSTPRRW